MSDGLKAEEEARNVVEEWFTATVASERQQRPGQGMSLGLAETLAEGVARDADADTYSREFKRHETEPIN